MEEELRFDGRVAVVTGAGRGLGRAYALELARRGASVVVNDLGGGVDGSGASADPGASVVAEIERLGGTAVASASSVIPPEGGREIVQTALDRFGRLDVLVNNASIAEGDLDWPEVSLERSALVIDVNLRGTVACTKLALPLMQPGGGAICNVASLGGYAPSLPQAVYVSTKAAIIHFSRSCEGLAESHGVRVTCLCPSAIDTPGLHGLGGAAGKPAWLRAALEQLELLDPADVAARIVAMLEDDAGETVVHLHGGGANASTSEEGVTP